MGVSPDFIRATTFLRMSLQRSNLDEAKRNPGGGVEVSPDFIRATAFLRMSLQCNDNFAEVRRALHIRERLARLRKRKDAVDHRPCLVLHHGTVHGLEHLA